MKHEKRLRNYFNLAVISKRTVYLMKTKVKYWHQLWAPSCLALSILNDFLNPKIALTNSSFRFFMPYLRGLKAFVNVFCPTWIT